MAWPPGTTRWAPSERRIRATPSPAATATTAVATGAVATGASSPGEGAGPGGAAVGWFRRQSSSTTWS